MVTVGVVAQANLVLAAGVGGRGQVARHDLGPDGHRGGVGGPVELERTRDARGLVTGVARLGGRDLHIARDQRGEVRGRRDEWAIGRRKDFENAAAGRQVHQVLGVVTAARDREAHGSTAAGRGLQRHELLTAGGHHDGGQLQVDDLVGLIDRENGGRHHGGALQGLQGGRTHVGDVHGEAVGKHGGHAGVAAGVPAFMSSVNWPL